MPTARHGQFHWNELMTRSVDKAKDFYADTLGWSYEPFPWNWPRTTHRECMGRHTANSQIYYRT